MIVNFKIWTRTFAARYVYIVQAIYTIVFKDEFAQGDRGETGEACVLCRGHRQHGEHEGRPILVLTIQFLD